MSILYCTVPHFAAALVRRDNPDLEEHPLVLVGPEDRVFAASAEAAMRGVVAGLTARTAQVRCPEARLLEADLPHCRQTFEALLQLLERFGPQVEAHGWGAAYVDLGDTGHARADAISLCKRGGREIRRELGDALQPALGWNSSKFTAQAAARHAHPGHLLAVPADRERDFLDPLPVTLLPLADDVLQRLRFLGLRTLGQYATLPPAAVWQQFGRPGRLAHRYARGEDDRPVVSRWQALRLTADCEFEVPLVERKRLLAALRRILSPLLAEIRGNLQACSQLRLTVHLDDGSAEERTRTFLFPTADEPHVMRILEQLLDGIHWTAAPSPVPGTGTFPFFPSQGQYTGRTGVVALQVTLEQIQDAVLEQLTLFPAENEREQKLDQVRRYLAARFGVDRLRRAALIHPNAPLPEWRVAWMSEGQP